MFPRKITAQSVCKTVPFRRGKGHPANVYKFTRVGPPSRSFQGKRDAHLFCTSREDILEAGLCDSFPLPLLSTQTVTGFGLFFVLLRRYHKHTSVDEKALCTRYQFDAALGKPPMAVGST